MISPDQTPIFHLSPHDEELCHQAAIAAAKVTDDVDQYCKIIFDTIGREGPHLLSKVCCVLSQTNLSARNSNKITHACLTRIDPKFVNGSISEQISCAEEKGGVTALAALWIHQARHNSDHEEIIKRLSQWPLSMDERFALCMLIASKGHQPAASLAKNIDKLDLNQANVEQRLNLCKFIATRGGSAATFLARNFDKCIRINELKLAERIDFVKFIASQGENSAEAIPTNFNKFILDGELNLGERLELFAIIGSEGPGAAGSLIRNFNKFIHEGELNFVERFALWRRAPILTLVDNLDKLDLDQASVEQRLNLYKYIASQAYYSAESLIFNVDKLNLNGTSVEQRLGLCKLIASHGKNIAERLASNLNKFGLDTEGDALISLARYYSQLGFQSSMNITLPWEMHPIKRQMYLELWKPPCAERTELRGNLSSGFMGVPRVLFDVLSRKAEEPPEKSLDSLRAFIDKNKKLDILCPLIDRVRAEKSKHIQTALVDWLAYTAGVLYDLEDEQINPIEASCMLDLIFDYKSPPNRYLFTRLLSDMALSREKLPKLDSKEPQHPYQYLSPLLLSPLRKSGFNIERLNEEICKIDVRTVPRFNTLIQFFQTVIVSEPYEPNEIDLIEKTVLKLLQDSPKRNPKKLRGNLDSLTNISKIFGRKDFLDSLEKVNNKVDPNTIFSERFSILFDVEKIEHLSQKFVKTFGSFREPTALFTYLRSVNALPADDKIRVKQTLDDYVNAVLENRFLDVRYSTEQSPHLITVFGSHPDIKEKWLNKAKPTDFFLQASTSTDPFNYEQFFEVKIKIDKHIEHSKIPRLIAFLNEESIGEIVDSEEPLEKLQNLAIQLLKREIDGEQFLQAIEPLKIFFPLPFQNDLDLLSLKNGSGGFLIDESDDPDDLLMIGTEIKGSCQRVDGSPELNKCLTSYLMNGEVKAIVIKKGNELVARSVIRLMWDSKKNTPVILLERVYSNIINPSINEKILGWAVDKAKKMNVPLVSREVDYGDTYEGTIEHLGGYAPYVYSDASGGVLEGPFQTFGCHTLYLPEEPGPGKEEAQ